MLPPDAASDDDRSVEDGLLAAIAADPDALGPRLVYADWLQSRGDPRGELIVVQHELRGRQGDADLGARERELVERAAAELAVEGVGPKAVGRWELGFVDELTLTSRELSVIRRTAPGWLERPPLRMVRLLDLTMRTVKGFRQLAQAPLARTVRRLRLGTASLPFDPAAAVAIARLAPALEELTLRADALPVVDPLGAVALTGFAFSGGDASERALESLARLPEGLASLELRVYRTGANALAALQPILRGDALPGLRRLALLGPFRYGDILEALAASGRARTLDSLVVNLRQVADDQLARLERHRDALAKLQLQPALANDASVDSRAYQQIASFLQHRLDRAADAVPVYEQAVRLDPRNTYARHGLGIALRNAKRPEEALAVLDALTRDTKPTAAVFYTRHYANCDLSRYADAAADLEQVVALDPKHADGWNGLAIERKRAGDFPGALAAFDTALGLQPAHEYAQRNRAALFLEYGQYAEGLPVVEQLLVAQPANDWLVFLRGVAHLGLGRGREAVAALTQVLATSNDRYHETALILRALAHAGADAAASRCDLAAALRRTNCPGKVGLCWLVAGLREPFPWPRALPPAAVEPPALSAAIAAYAQTVRPSDAPPLHAAEPWDHVEAAEHAIAGALQSGDRTLAVARMRALHAFLAASPKPIVLSWSHGLAQVFRAVGAPLDAEARSILATVSCATRGRVPRDSLLEAAGSAAG